MEFHGLYEIRPGLEMQNARIPKRYADSDFERHVTYTLHERGGYPEKTPGRCGCRQSKKRRQMAKLDSRQKAEIQRLYARGGVTQAEIAKVYGVTQAYVSCIIRCK